MSSDETKQNESGSGLTLSLEGEVSLQDFAKAMEQFKKLLNSLRDDVASSAQINWIVKDLKSGSASAMVVGIPETDNDNVAVSLIESACDDASSRFEHGEVVPYGRKVNAALRGLSAITNGRVTAVRLGRKSTLHTISSTVVETVVHQWNPMTYGCAKGRMKSISDRNYAHFTLYDNNDDHAILCNLCGDRAEEMRQYWNKLVYVEGIVNRDPATDLITSIKDITCIEIIPENEKWDYKAALGCLA
ncbi:MAG: hypothetical protein AB7F23_05770 [Phycisphaerae bacterium]